MRYSRSTPLAIIALLACFVAHGQVVGPETPSRTADPATMETPLFEVYQAIFSLLYSAPKLSSEDAKASAAGRLEAIGLDGKAAQALASYVSDGLAQQRDLSDAKMAQLCRLKTSYTSKAQVGDAFAKIYDELDGMQERLWGNFDFLDEKNRRILSSYAAKRKTEMRLGKNDPRGVLERSSETLPQILGRICKEK